jgi:hypothetical protein
MTFLDVPVRDWVSLIAGLVGWIAAWLARRDSLPPWAKKWLKRIGRAQVSDAVERAASLAELTPEQRRSEAVIFLQKLAVAKLGFPVPSSIANLLIENAYQQWKRRKQ